MTVSQPAALVLASSSRYRKALLERLGLPFSTAAPGAEESPLTGESPHAMALRLAQIKAESVAAQQPGGIVIGSDQVAAVGEQILGKPGNHHRAVQQLRMASGRQMDFHTGVHIVDGRSGRAWQHVDLTRVYFRSLSDEEIEAYLRRDAPYDCAGSFKAEALGIVLFERIVSEDPTALTGLPLIRVADVLRQCGLTPLR